MLLLTKYRAKNRCHLEHIEVSLATKTRQYRLLDSLTIEENHQRAASKFLDDHQIYFQLKYLSGQGTREDCMVFRLHDDHRMGNFSSIG